MRRVAVISVIFLTLAVAFQVAPCRGMIATLKLPDLVRRSELICIAKVVQKSDVVVDPEQITTVKNVLEATSILKGDWNVREPIVVMSIYGGKAGMPGWLEDQVEFPVKGEHVLVFLEKAEDGSLRTVNTVQGVWPLEQDQRTPYGMGLGFTLADVKEQIEEQK